MAGVDPVAPGFRAGTVAIVGRPNVGKSTLVNALVGFRLSIVAPKPQTTRHRILGVRTTAQHQIVLLDTPGLHDSGGRAINRLLNRTARGALEEADVVALVIEAGSWREADQSVLKLAAASGRALVLVLNKIDRLARKDDLLPLFDEMAKRHAFSAMVPLSASKGDGVEALASALAGRLPLSEPLFAADELTDRSERFLVTERIREQLVRQLHQELPYATTVEVERFKREGHRYRIDAVIWVERDSQKAIVIGDAGARIKEIGIKARRDLIELLEAPVHLNLWCKVRNDWSDDAEALKRFGYGE